MASQAPDDGGNAEHCGSCGRETPHAARIELRTESSAAGGSPPSRDPYRVAVCRNCGAERVERVDDP